MNRHLVYRFFFLLAFASAISFPHFAIADTPILAEAINLACENSLELKDADARLQMKLAECWQAGLFPNPALTFQFNEIRFPGKKSVLGFLQASFAVTQLIELGNKRTARQNVIAAEAASVLWETETIKQGIIKKVIDAYADYFAAQKKLILLNKYYQNATEIVDCLTEKVSSGKASLLLQRKSILARHAIAMDLKKIEFSIASIQRQFFLLCGNGFNFQVDPPEFFQELAPPLPMECYLCQLSNNAEISQLQSMQMTAYFNYYLQKANSVPNLVVSTGLEHDSPWGGCRLSLGLGIELPICNQNQGNISRAAWEGHAILYRIQSLEKEMVVRCQNLYAELLRNYETIAFIGNELIPASEELIQIHSNREIAGKEDCLERLAANKEFLDLQMQYIDAINEFHHLNAELRILCGQD